MKKKRMRRTKHTKKNFFDDKKLVAVSIAFFLIFAFLLMFVVNNPSLPGSAQITGAQVGKSEGIISGLFSDWAGGNLDKNLAKVLLWATLLMFIASVLNFVKFPTHHGFLQFLLALIISFLATAYITPEEVYVILATYSALGITLGILIPFLVILFTSAMLLSNEKLRDISLGKVVLQVVIWVMWGSFLVYRFIKLWVEEGFGTILKGGGIVLLAVTVISLLILFFNPFFRKWIWNIGNQLREIKEEAKSRSEAARERGRTRVEQAREDIS